ncbi:MAG TPA: MFS transporter [Pseudorhodoplanes sp.]|jgi:predicted MFS family arabinose efflux permease|nr:MFS transporter [Pseudorhodoplanes sp.]
MGPADPGARAAPPSAGGSGSATRAIALLSLAAFASQSMVRVLDSLLPQIASDLSVTVGAASIAVSAYGAAHGSVQLVIGPVGDRFGKYAVVIAACIFCSGLVLLCGLAQTLPALVAARMACGLAAGVIIPMGMAFVGDVTPYERRQPVLARFFSGQILGMLVGQAAGGILGDFLGWRRVFFFLAALFAVAAAALVIEFLRNPLTHAPKAGPERARGFVADYATVLANPWARIVILAVFLEAALLFGSLAFVGADLHLRFDLGFSVIGLVVGAFAVGGLIYITVVSLLVARLGQTGLAIGGGFMLCAALCALAAEPWWQVAPFAVTGLGLGFYMLHNTLQTNATQMSPEARSTAVAIFSSALYLGQTAGVAAAAVVVDRYTAVPVFILSAALFPVLALWFARKLVHHRNAGRA